VVWKPHGRWHCERNGQGKEHDLAGKAKEAVGNITGDARTRDEGRGDQAKSNIKDAGEKIKDAFKK
jgi:uncharacterized protein YjbJ (UPF0337 family)